MVRVAEGDSEALGALYDRHAPLMLGIGQRILRSRREAEDILHDVFVEVWRRAGDYDAGRGSVRAWLLLRMRSRCLDRVKSAGYSRSRPLPEREDAGGAVAAEGDRSADGRNVRAALLELPDEQRQVLLLGYFQGLSSSEIAEEMGIPTGTVKSRVAAAMAKMRAVLGGET